MSGQFLIDSESNLREAFNKMIEIKKAAHPEKEKAVQHTDEHKRHKPEKEKAVQHTGDHKGHMMEMDEEMTGKD
jgi:hypothetical protein